MTIIFYYIYRKFLGYEFNNNNNAIVLNYNIFRNYFFVYLIMYHNANVFQCSRLGKDKNVYFNENVHVQLLVHQFYRYFNVICELSKELSNYIINAFKINSNENVLSQFTRVFNFKLNRLIYCTFSDILLNHKFA